MSETEMVKRMLEHSKEIIKNLESQNARLKEALKEIIQLLDYRCEPYLIAEKALSQLSNQGESK